MVSSVVVGTTSNMALGIVVGRWVWWVGVVVLVLWVLEVGREGRGWEVTPKKIAKIAKKTSPSTFPTVPIYRKPATIQRLRAHRHRATRTVVVAMISYPRSMISYNRMGQ